MATVVTWKNFSWTFTETADAQHGGSLHARIYIPSSASGLSQYFDYYYHNEELDLSDLANRRKFVTDAGAPVYLGSDGSTPTGTQPLYFFTGGGTAFLSNKGTVSLSMAKGGSADVATASTSPTD